MALVVLMIAAALAGVSVVVAVLEGPGGVPNASATYLLAVVVVAVAAGTTPAIVTAIGSFLLYDFLFVEPFYTLTVRDPTEWLNLLLLLVLGTVVGRLAGEQRRTGRPPLGRGNRPRRHTDVTGMDRPRGDRCRRHGSRSRVRDSAARPPRASPSPRGRTRGVGSCARTRAGPVGRWRP